MIPTGELATTGIAETEATVSTPTFLPEGLITLPNPFAPGRRDATLRHTIAGPPLIYFPEEPKPTYRVVRAEVTAYVPGGGVTANGTDVSGGKKAISAPKNIPFGTMIEIEGYGTAEVVDRGGAIKIKPDGTYIFDILLPTKAEADRWGRRKMEVKIYDSL
jgi:3D (Asp-Asp-Asp) domain-containing protein